VPPSLARVGALRTMKSKRMERTAGRQWSRTKYSGSSACHARFPPSADEVGQGRSGRQSHGVAAWPGATLGQSLARAQGGTRDRCDVSQVAIAQIEPSGAAEIASATNALKVTSLAQSPPSLLVDDCPPGNRHGVESGEMAARDG